MYTSVSINACALLEIGNSNQFSTRQRDLPESISDQEIRGSSKYADSIALLIAMLRIPFISALETNLVVHAEISDGEE